MRRQTTHPNRRARQAAALLRLAKRESRADSEQLQALAERGHHHCREAQILLRRVLEA